jgi:hypothetical protein
MRRATAFIAALVVTGCATTGETVSSQAVTTLPPTTIVTTTSSTSTTIAVPSTTTTTVSPFARPNWLGTRLLPLRPDGHGEVQPTPPELVDRQLETIDQLAPPQSGGWESSISEVPDEVLARSSWVEGCPVGVDELRYVTLSHHGFDGEVHTGEILVNAAEAEGVVEVFRKLFEAGFPIEQMQVTRLEEIDDHPTGDFNQTGSFACRPAVGSSNWSLHAYGLAVDINPFHNPYMRNDLVIPELASAYVDRENVRPGMIYDDDVVVAAFAEIGWSWGGDWTNLKDWMHFSKTGR